VMAGSVDRWRLNRFNESVFAELEGERPPKLSLAEAVQASLQMMGCQVPRFARGGVLLKGGVPIALEQGYVVPNAGAARRVGLTADAVRMETPITLKGTSYATRKLFTDGHR
jgi:hypothetical protein